MCDSLIRTSDAFNRATESEAEARTKVEELVEYPRAVHSEVARASPIPADVRRLPVESASEGSPGPTNLAIVLRLRDVGTTVVQGGGRPPARP